MTAVEPTKNELHITEVPTILTNKHFASGEEENETEIDNFTDAYYSTLNYESDSNELSRQKEIVSTQEKKVVSTNASSDNQGQISISNASSNDDVSNGKPEEISSVQSRRENTSRTSSTDSLQTDVSEKENYNVSDHESDTSYEKEELEKDEKMNESVDQDKIRSDSSERENLVDKSKDQKEAVVTTEAESKSGFIEEELPTPEKSENNSGENNLGNLNSLEEFEDKSGENNVVEKKSDEKLVENSSSETIDDDKIKSEPSEEFTKEQLDNFDTNTISNASLESVTNDSLTKKNDPLHNNDKEIPQNIPDHEMQNNTSSSFSSEYDQNVRSSMTESLTSKSSSFSLISMQQSIDFTNEKENQDIIDDKNALNRVSVASLKENPELNDISLDDNSSHVQESPKEWHFSDWGFPKTPTSLKSISTFFSPRSTTSTVTSTTSTPTKSSSNSEKIDSRRTSTISTGSTGSNYDLLLARLEKENQILKDDPKAKRMSLQGIAELKASFERVQHESQIDDGIDWDFWGQVISDYETVAKSQSRQLSKTIQNGIPQALRGMIWQLMSKSKDSELESTYAQLLKKTSPHEKMIMRDLSRTFPKHEFFQDQDGVGQEGLFNVVKAYSLYDTDVGYCQGISFVVGPLLLNMPDEEAFCVLVKLMKHYNMRSHFLPGMDGLQLRLFQFDRLVEEMLPKVHNHLQAQGVNSSMYASQWFMTLFAYKFPLSLVFRIYDTIFTEGIESIFRFSIALLKKNEKRIVEMEFEKLLEYLKSGLFENYQITHTGVLAQLVKERQYHTNDFVKDAYNVRITHKKLNKYQQLYYAQQEAEKRKLLADADAIETLRSNNSHLLDRVKNLESSLETRDREHIELANELINTKMTLAKVMDENDGLNSIVTELHKTIENQPEEIEAKLREGIEAELRKGIETKLREEIEAKLREEMNTLAEKNVSFVQKNNILEDQLANLENMLIEIKMRYAESENEREVLQRKWNDLKKAIG